MREPSALADRLFLIAHHERTGAARVNERAVALGLAGAILGELVMEQRIVIQEGLVYVANPRPPHDPLLHVVMSMLRQSHHTDLRIWLAFLAETAVRDVGKRLEREDIVEMIQRRRFVHVHRYYVPCDGNVAAWQSVRLSNLLTERRSISVSDTVLAKLVESTGLLGHVLWSPETAGDARDYLHQMAQFLDPSLASLVAHTDAAVGHLALAPR